MVDVHAAFPPLHRKTPRLFATGRDKKSEMGVDPISLHTLYHRYHMIKSTYQCEKIRFFLEIISLFYDLNMISICTNMIWQLSGACMGDDRSDAAYLDTLLTRVTDCHLCSARLPVVCSQKHVSVVDQVAVSGENT